MNSIAQKINNQIKVKKPGSVFTPMDFQKVGSKDAIDQTLSRLAKSGVIRRLGQGIYEKRKRVALEFFPLTQLWWQKHWPEAPRPDYRYQKRMLPTGWG